MAHIDWNASLETGDLGVDGDHAHLVSLVNQLFDAVDEGAPRVTVLLLLDGLTAHTRNHFRHEEQEMLAAGYPGAGLHRIEHARLTQRVVEVQRALSAGGLLTIDVVTLLTEWLLPHIRRWDVPLGAFLDLRRRSMLAG